MIESLPANDSRLLFFKQGISGYDSSSGIYKTMKTIINVTGIRSDNLILKMDVEGTEWEFIKSTDSEIFSLFKQMTFELHGLADMGRKEEILECLSKLRETHIPVWVHGNNAGAAEVSGNYVVPEMLEITYARKEDYVFSEKSYSCPLSIDFPNISDFNDICLKDWGSVMCENRKKVHICFVHPAVRDIYSLAKTLFLNNLDNLPYEFIWDESNPQFVIATELIYIDPFMQKNLNHCIRKM